jgi:EPS-associated MarR family transcriptional regulator
LVPEVAFPHTICSNHSSSTVEQMSLTNSHEISDELRFRILKLVSENPAASQRELARGLGVSVGKLNYCLRALIEKGLVKIRRFTNSRRKAAYLYVLTPHGAKEKLRVAYRFLESRRLEYETLRQEIESLSDANEFQSRDESANVK